MIVISNTKKGFGFALFLPRFQLIPRENGLTQKLSSRNYGEFSQCFLVLTLVKHVPK